jgi:hypothetical protein
MSKKIIVIAIIPLNKFSSELSCYFLGFDCVQTNGFNRPCDNETSSYMCKTLSEGI